MTLRSRLPCGVVSTAVLWGSARAAAAGTSVPVPTWRRVKKVGTIVTFSWLMAVPVWCAILASLRRARLARSTAALRTNGVWHFPMPISRCMARSANGPPHVHLVRWLPGCACARHRPACGARDPRPLASLIQRRFQCFVEKWVRRSVPPAARDPLAWPPPVLLY